MGRGRQRDLDGFACRYVNKRHLFLARRNNSRCRRHQRRMLGVQICCLVARRLPIVHVLFDNKIDFLVRFEDEESALSRFPLVDPRVLSKFLLAIERPVKTARYIVLPETVAAPTQLVCRVRTRLSSGGSHLFRFDHLLIRL